MNRIFNLLYWSTFGTKGTQCCAAGRKRAQGMPFQDVSGRCPVPRNGHHDWPHLPLTQQPQHSEERREHSDKAWRNIFSTVQGGKVISDQRTDGFRHHLHFPCSWKRLWVTISYCDCICGVVWLFFPGERGRKAGKLHKSRQYRRGKENGRIWGNRHQDSAMQNLSLYFSNIECGHARQRNAQTGLSFFQQFVWHTAHVSVKMLCMPCGAEIILLW